MKNLLLEFLKDILGEAPNPKIASSRGGPRKTKSKSTEPQTTTPDKKPADAKFPGSFGKWYRDAALTQYVGKMDKGRWIDAKQEQEPKSQQPNSRDGNIQPERPQQTGKPTTTTQQPTIKQPTESNTRSLETFIRTGSVLDASGKPSRPPGNDFSRYSEAVSSLLAQQVAQERQQLAPDQEISTEELVRRLVKLDCGSELLTDDVTQDLPSKKSPLYAEFEQLEKNGVFDGCETKYSREQNFARFLTAKIARTKGLRMTDAVSELQNSGIMPSGDVQIDSFSGDYQSLTNMKSMLTSMPEDAKIFTETGEELSREEAMEFIGGFGTSDFPADTALIARDSSGNLVLIGFSDKQDLRAIINNTSVSAELTRNEEVIDGMLSAGKIDRKQAIEAKRAIQESGRSFAAVEDKIAEVSKSPVLAVIDIFDRSNATTGKRERASIDAEVADLIEGLKDSAPSKGGPTDRYFKKRISQPFLKAAKLAKENARKGKKNNKRDEREYLEWLRKAGWDETSDPTEEQMVHAWALRCRAYADGEIKDANNEPKPLPIKDQTLLLNCGVVDEVELYEELGQLRSQCLEVLTNLREELDRTKVGGVGLGTFLDAVTAWKALHLDMREYKGALTVVAGETVVDFLSIEDCLQGISSSTDFAKSLQITPAYMRSRDVVDREGNPIVTGQKVEVFSVNQRGQKIRIGVKSLRSKMGIAGKIQITWNYHPDMQKCLEKHTR